MIRGFSPWFGLEQNGKTFASGQFGVEPSVHIWDSEALWGECNELTVLSGPGGLQGRYQAAGHSAPAPGADGAGKRQFRCVDSWDSKYSGDTSKIQGFPPNIPMIRVFYAKMEQKYRQGPLLYLR